LPIIDQEMDPSEIRGDFVTVRLPAYSQCSPRSLKFTVFCESYVFSTCPVPVIDIDPDIPEAPSAQDAGRIPPDGDPRSEPPPQSAATTLPIRTIS
jgi:hypothetical protein